MEIAEKISRVSVPALDEILGHQFKVLDEGFVRVVDYMGADESIVQAARVSYGKGTKKLSEDRGLIRYLMRHRHSTPFEMCEIKFHVKVPMDCWRQWIRHRMANVNEYSTRYSEAIDCAQKTSPDEWRLQSELNKQGSSGFVTDWPEDDKEHEYPRSFTSEGLMATNKPGDWLTAMESKLQKQARDVYEERLKFGVAREQARKDLPLSTYTEAYWKCDLHNLLHFLGLRMDGHAQKEIRDFATVMGKEIVAKWVPLSWEAFTDYRMSATYLSRMEMEILTVRPTPGTIDFSLASAHPGNSWADRVTALAQSFGWLEKNVSGKLKTNRERAEMEAKLIKFGLDIPWKE